MFCKNCGKTIPDDSKYCPFCGANVSDLPFSDTPARSDTELHVEYLRMSSTKEETVVNIEKKQKSPIVKMAYAVSTIGAIAVVMLMVCCVLFNFNKTDSTQSDRNFNIFKAVWFITCSTLMVVCGVLSLIISFFEKASKSKEIQHKIKKIFISRILQLVFSIAAAAGLCVMAYFCLKNPSFFTKSKTYQIVPSILTFVVIIVFALGLSVNNYLLPRKAQIKKI